MTHVRKNASSTSILKMNELKQELLKVQHELKQELLKVQHELQDLEMQEQLQELQDRSSSRSSRTGAGSWSWPHSALVLACARKWWWSCTGY